TANLLNDDRVLIAGGADDGQRSLSSCEIYDSTERKWELTSPMNVDRQRHTSDLLSDGRVLVAGGYVGGGHPSLIEHFSGPGNRSYSSTELFDPVSEEWSPGPSLITGRFWHRSVQLQNGDILVVGGMNITDGVLASCEILRAGSNQWIEASILNTPRARCTISLLSDGRVLITGGHEGAYKIPLASCEIYDPVSDDWEFTSPMSKGRGYHAGVLLKDSRYLVSGGFSSPTTVDWQDAEIFDPSKGTWTITGEMSQPRHNHLLIEVSDGNVIMVGGSNCFTGGCHSTMEFYDPLTGIWEETYQILVGRKWNTGTVLRDGSVLIVGGRSCGEPTSMIELFIPPSVEREDIGMEANSVFMIVIVCLLITLILVMGIHHWRMKKWE
ncbi:MAG: hypothetical protein U9R75_05720, partial [Candidatus Thermoplasmatota archaeon]|nr:hypothetical protein [Candidatus Thermoplasmatota archaeon]